MATLFNINGIVRVRLKPAGLFILRKNAAELRKVWPKMQPYRDPVPDAEGYVRFQLWDLMQTFGPYCGLGAEPPFETDIVLETPCKLGAAA